MSDLNTKSEDTPVDGITFTVPNDFEGGIYIGRDKDNKPVLTICHRDDGNKAVFPPKGYRFDAQSDSNFEVFRK